MYQKVSLYFLLTTSFLCTCSINYLQAHLIQTVTLEHNEQFDLEETNENYDHLDFLADYSPEIPPQTTHIPHWVKSFFIGIIVRLSDLSESWQKTWEKIKSTFTQQKQ